MSMQSEYVENRNGGYYVAGTRITLDSVVLAFQRGDSAETIFENFARIEKLSRVYGAIAFYLDHKAEVDEYLRMSERDFEVGGIPLSQTNPALWERLQRAKAGMGETRA